MNQYLEQIMQMANLSIEAYDVQTRREMASLNRRMPCYIMSYLQSGEAVLEIYGETYTIGAGSIIIIPENVLHSHYKTDNLPATFLWWHFNFNFQYTIDALKLLNLPVVSYLKNKEGFEQIFFRFYDGSKRLKETFNIHDQYTPSSQTGTKMNKLSEVLMHRACGLELMAYLVEELIADKKLLLNTNIPKEFWQIFEMVNSKDNKDITLESLGKDFAMSSTYISNRFKYYFGLPPIAMRNNILFERAKILIKSGDKSIGEISEEMGFDSIAGFTHFFTKKAGMSPSEFKRLGSILE